MAETVVQISGLAKVFQRDSFAVPALENIDLTVETNVFLCLMGPSGSGKTTLLNIIAGIDRPTAGELRVLGEDVARMSEDRLATWRNIHVGFVFQTFNLIPVLTAYENVELPLLYTNEPVPDPRARALEALASVGLRERADHHPNQLSGGQQQRVAIARALVNNPQIILADEPTGALDSRTSIEIMAIFQHLNRRQGITTIIVTHEPDIAAYANRNIYFRDGRIVRDEKIAHPMEADEVLMHA